jgi:hypothetical protein
VGNVKKEDFLKKKMEGKGKVKRGKIPYDEGRYLSVCGRLLDLEPKDKFVMSCRHSTGTRLAGASA